MHPSGAGFISRDIEFPGNKVSNNDNSFSTITSCIELIRDGYGFGYTRFFLYGVKITRYPFAREDIITKGNAVDKSFLVNYARKTMR